MMRLKGVNYDVGIDTRPERSSRPILPPEVVAGEMEIIARDLHCNAVRISGFDVERLRLASEQALKQGMEVWLSPNDADATEAELLPYLAECARAAETLRQQSPHIVFVVGTELTLFMRGIIDNRPSMERLSSLMKPVGMVKFTLLQGLYGRRLNRLLAKAVAVVREHFHGPVTYAAGSWEKVDWTPFDFVSVDHYRDASNENNYVAQLRDFFRHGKPVFITEFGSCTYTGAKDKGGVGWAIVNWATDPPMLVDEFTRDEWEQAGYLRDLLGIFQHEDVEGAFVFTFVNTGYPTSDEPDLDLDMASYSLVKTYADRHGTRYPDMTWEPKEAFDTVARIYAGITGALTGPEAPFQAEA